MTPLEKLKAAYPIFTIKNRFAYPNEFGLANGESVMVPPLGISKILSSHIINMPDQTKFEILNPPVSALIETGVIVVKSLPSQDKSSTSNDLK